MTSLKEINFGLNQYCGPAVLSALTGKSTDECAAVISAITGKAVIQAVYNQDLMKAFNKLGFDYTPVEAIGRTLYGTLFRLAKQDGMYIVGVPHHVVAVEVTEGRAYIIDNHTKEPLLVSHSSRLMQKVTHVNRITKKRAAIQLKTEYDVIKANGKISIFRTIIFADDRDNVRIPLGSFVFQNDEELITIFNQMADLVIRKI